MSHPLSRTAILAALATTLGCGTSPLQPLAQRLAGCPVGAAGGGQPASGRYAYGACDEQGRLALLGHLDLVIDATGAIAGTWEIEWAPGADRSTEVGPQVGSGELEGWLDGADATLHLNPGWADNNVRLTGTWHGGGGGGFWSYSTLTGPRSSGSFTARR
jgi:hypothetical protein